MNKKINRISDLTKANQSIQIFQNNEFGEVRILQKDNILYFIAKDIAQILGYATTEKMTRRLDNDEKSNVVFQGWGNPTNVTQITIISESGLYNSILGSKKDEAKKFKKWITSEIIPSIRQNGGYISNEEMFINMYLPDASDAIKEKFKSTITKTPHFHPPIEEI